MKIQPPKLPCTIPKFNRSRYNGHKCNALPLLHRGNHHLLYLKDNVGCGAIGPTGLQVYLGVHAKSIIIGRNLLSMYHKLYSTEVAKLIPVFIDAMRAANSCQLAVRRGRRFAPLDTFRSLSPAPAPSSSVITFAPHKPGLLAICTGTTDGMSV